MSTLSTISPEPSLYWNDITEKQQRCIDRLYEGDCLFIAPLGFGKHVCLQTAAEELLDNGILKRVLVLTTLRNATQVWGAEWAKWDHLSRPGIACGAAWEREVVLQNRDYDIVVINNENVPWLMGVPDFEKLGFDGLIIDEVGKYKSPGAKQVKALRRHIKNFEWRVGATATPVAEAGVDLYTQMLMVDNGKTLGRNRDKFLHTFFMQMDYSGYKWDFQPMGQKRLAEAIAPSLLVADSESYEEGLPPLNDIVQEIPLNKDAMAAYEEMAKEMYLDFTDDDAEAMNEAVLAGKLQQLASGFVYTSTGETVRLSMAKMQWLQNYVDTDMLGAGGTTGHGLLIMYNFTAELQMLKALWPDIPVYADNPKEYERLWNAGEITGMAIHPKSAGHGLNLQKGGHTLIALGPCWSADDWRQVIGRLHRRGQLNPVTRITLAGKDTIDLDILDRLAGKRENEGLLMGHLKSVAEKSPE